MYYPKQPGPLTDSQKRVIVDEATILADELLADELLADVELPDAARFSMKRYLLSNIPVRDGYFDSGMFIQIFNQALDTGQCIPFMANKTSQSVDVVIRDKNGNVKHQEQSRIEVIRDGNSN